MVILILGIAGNLGTAFSKFLATKENISLVAWDKAELDVTDEGILAKKISDIKPNIIINLVSYNKVDACEKDEVAKNLARSLNIDLVKSLGSIALANQAILLHYSSDYVFKGDHRSGYKEDDVPAPINFYGQTKLEGEQELIKLTGKGLKWYLIRTARLFGTRGTSSDSKLNFFELLLRFAKANKQIRLVTNEVGSFTHTLDLAQASWDLIEQSAPFGIYHLINSGVASWHEAGAYFLNKLGLKVDIEPIKSQAFHRPAKRPKNSLLLNTKRPILRPWQEAVDEYVEQISNV